METVTLEGAYIPSGNIKIYTEIFGKGGFETIILLPTLSGDLESWSREFCEMLVSFGYQVIRFDFREAGQSSLVDFDKNPYTLKDLAKDVVVILDYFSIEKAHIAGISFGGFISQLAVLNFPDRFLSMVLFITSCERKGINSLALRQEPKGNVLPLPSKKLSELFVRAVELTNDQLEEKLQVKIELEKEFYGSELTFNKEEVLQVIKRTFNRTKTPNHYLQASLMTPDILEKLDQIKLPTLIVHGKQDPLFSVEHGEFMHREISNSTLEWIPELGHCFPKAYFKRVAEIFKNFWQKS